MNDGVWVISYKYNIVLELAKFVKCFYHVVFTELEKTLSTSVQPTQYTP